MRKIISWIVMVFIFPLILLPCHAWGAQDSGFTLDVLASAAKEVSFTVPPSGSIPIRIMQKGAPVPGMKVDLYLSEFVGEQGLSVGVKLTVDTMPLTPAAELKRVPFSGVFLPIHLTVPPLPAPGKYSGTLVLVNPKNTSREVWLFKLTSAQEMRPATLVLDQGSATLSGIKPVLFGKNKDPSITVHLRDKTGFWMLDGIIARLEPGLIVPGNGFSIERDLSAEFNNKSVDNIGTSPPTGTRSVLPGQQATLKFQFKNLDVGTYTVPLRVIASNSGQDDQQRLTVTIKVKHWWFWAALILVLAAIVSFIGTQLAIAIRRKSAFLERGQGMRPAWLSTEKPSLPVIWYRAKVRQIEDLSNRFWLTGQTGIDLKLTQAAGMLPILDRIHHLRNRLNQSLEEEPIRNRAIWHLDSIISGIDADPSDQEITQIKAELDALEKCLDPMQTDGCYWDALRPRISKLLSEIETDNFPAEGKDEMLLLKKDLEDGVKSQPNHNELTMLERRYQRLLILWNYHEREDTELFLKLFVVKQDSISQLFATVDKAVWERLKEIKNKNKLWPEGPLPDSLNPIEAYMPVTFELDVSDDPKLMETFLVKKKLKYIWKFEINQENIRHKNGKKGELEVTSAEPKVTQYSPIPGQIVLKEVRILNASEKEPIVIQRSEANEKEGRWVVPVSKSSEFRIWRIAEKADFIALAIASIAGVTSGLMLYMQNPTFGSAQDYLQLFMWGAGIDQGKNLIQALGSWGSGKQ